MYHLANRRPFVADDHRVGADRAQPVKEVQDLRSSHTGEGLLVATGKSDHLMRKHRPDNDYLIVIEDAFINFNTDFL